jgi:hypothetical protein
MNHKGRIAGIAVGVILATGVAWVALQPRDPIFHGRRESEWITNIVYLSEDQNNQQVQRWRDFGPGGLRVLERGLAANRAPKYLNAYDRLAKFLPNGLMRLLPTPPPKTVGGTRYQVVDLLCRMGKDAHPAWPAVTRALSDEDPMVRSRAVSFFTHPEADKAFLNQLPAKEKKKLLPLFIRAVEDGGWHWNLRNNAALALKYYPEEAPLVAPPLVKALKDSSPYVRLSAADALNAVDPVAGSKAGAVTVVAKELQNRDQNLSWQAAISLREFQLDAALAVTALIEAIDGTNSMAAANALPTLDYAFHKHADRIIPELRKAAGRTDTAGGYARSALKGLESRAAKPQP